MAAMRSPARGCSRPASVPRSCRSTPAAPTVAPTSTLLGATLWFTLTGTDADAFDPSRLPIGIRPTLVRALARDIEQLPHGRRLGTCPPVPIRRQAPRSRPVPRLRPFALGARVSRRICEDCGRPLAEPCLACGRDNPVWVRYCDCGCNQPEAIDRERDRLELACRRYGELMASQDYEQAARLLAEVAEVTHPRLQDYRSWAEVRLPEAEWKRADRARHAATRWTRHGHCLRPVPPRGPGPARAGAAPEP